MSPAQDNGARSGAARRDMTRAKPSILGGIALVALLAAALPGSAQESNADKARALVQAAIKMTDSVKAVKALWQATDIDPTFEDAYVYLGLYYNSRQDFADVVKVYQKLVKYEPNQVSAYLNIGEAYMSFSPARAKEALPYYRKAYELDPTSSFAALRIGEILAHEGKRDEAIRYLKQARGDRVKHPNIAAEAEKILNQMGAP